ncbi:MAG: pantetheine-phosphate adenylyltransferase [Acholeplasmataceae bacterium]
MKKGLYAGTFDPPTYGHLDMIKRAAKLVNHLYIVVADNPRKNTIFSVDERVKMLEKLTNKYSNVSITYTDDLVVRFAELNKIRILFRGLRNIADYENEYQLYQFNRNLNPNVETVVLFPTSRNHFVSSSSIKELVYHHADISKYVPKLILDEVIKGLPKK